MKISNNIIKHEEYAEIILADKKGNETGRALVDLEDLIRLELFDVLFLNNKGYVAGFPPWDKHYPVMIHRSIARAKKGQSVIFKNKNKLDLRKNNLIVK